MKNAEIADPVECVEIPEDGREHGVHQAEGVAGEPRASTQLTLEKPEALVKGRGLLVQA